MTNDDKRAAAPELVEEVAQIMCGSLFGALAPPNDNDSPAYRASRPVVDAMLVDKCRIAARAILAKLGGKP